MSQTNSPASAKTAPVPLSGTAGKILNRILSETGLRRDELYITNAVKHFKFESNRGRRQGQTPAVDEIEACHPWLDSELNAVKPQLIVALGTVTARNLLGQPVTISESLDSWIHTPQGQDLLATYHPSAAIRASIEADGDRSFDAIAQSLNRAQNALSTGRPGTHAGRQPSTIRASRRLVSGVSTPHRAVSHPI